MSAEPEVKPVNADGSPWWFDKPRGETWAEALKAQQARLSISQFGKSHRLATGPNVTAEEAGEARRRRSRLELVDELNGRRIAS